MKFSNRGQATIGLTIIISVILFIMMMNLQTQSQNVQQTIVQAKAQAEADNAINDFALQLYNAYVKAAVVPDSFPNTRAISPTPGISQNGFDFYLVDGKLCSSRTRNIPASTSFDICITLPADFAALLQKSDLMLEMPLPKPSYYVQILKSIFGARPAFAQKMETDPFAPNPNNSPPLVNVNSALVGNDLVEFLNQYENFNCETPAGRAACVKIKICLRLRPCTTDDQKLKQTFVFLRVPNSQLRN